MDVFTFARGYIDLIGARDRGRGLGQAADFVQPVLDVFDLLAIQKRRQILAGPTPLLAGPNTVAFANVPASTVWRVLSVEFDVDLVMGDICDSCHLIAAPSEGSDTPGMGISLTESATFTGPLSVVRLAQFPGGLLFPAGTSFLVHWDATLAAGAPNAIMRLLVEEFRV